jgi:hypothetical protein
MSACSQVRRVRWRAASQSRKAVAWVICSPANCRLEGVIGLFAAAGTESGQDVPGGEALDELGSVGVGDRVEMGDEPALEQADLLVDAWQDLAGHEQLTQVRGGPPGLQGVKRLVGQRDFSSSARIRVSADRSSPWGCRARSGSTAGARRRAASSPAAPVQGGSPRRRRREFAKPVAQGAAGTQPAAVQFAFLGAAAAPKRCGEPRAVRTDRGLITSAQPGKHPVGSAPRATPSKTQRPVRAGATNGAIRPAASLVLASAAPAAFHEVPAFVLLIAGVVAAHSSGRIRAGRGRGFATVEGAGRSSVAVLRTPTFSAVVATTSAGAAPLLLAGAVWRGRCGGRRSPDAVFAELVEPAADSVIPVLRRPAGPFGRGLWCRCPAGPPAR